MEKKISDRQTTCLLIIFIFGNSALFSLSRTAGRDSWISLLAGAIGALLVSLIYARIYQLNPGKGFFETLTIRFGKKVGGVLSVLMTWYSFHLAALLLRSVIEYGKSKNSPSPPYYLIAILMLCAGAFLVSSGEAVLGRWSYLTVILLIGISLFTTLTAVRFMKPESMLPMFRKPIKEVTKSAFQYLTFPFLEGVMILPILMGNGNKHNSYKVYRWGIIGAAIILLMTLSRNLLLLGEPLLDQLYFPSYSAAKLISVGNFFTRVEEIISVFMLLSGMTKLAVFLMTSSKGLAHACGSKDTKSMVTPVALLSFALTVVVCNSIMELDNFIAIYPLYAAVFQLGIPIIIWIASEYQNRKNKRIETRVCLKT